MSATIAAPPLVPGPRLGRLTAVELRKMTDTRAGFWLLVSNALIALAAVVVRLVWAPADEQTLARFFMSTVEAMSVLLPVLGILAVTSEWSQRTALTTFTLVPRRERPIAAKLVAGAVLALIAVPVCLAAAVVGAALTDAGASSSLSLDLVGRATLYELLSVIGGIALGLAVMSSPPAIVAYFLVPITVSALTSAIPGFSGTAAWLDVPTGSLSQLLGGHMTGEAWAQLASGTILWVALPLAIGLARLRRREVAS